MIHLQRIAKLTFEQKLRRYPPILLRLLTLYGTTGNRWCPTDQEFAEKSGMSLAEVKYLSYSTTFDHVPVQKMYAFLRGCQVDLEKRRHFKRLEWMRRRGLFRHLKKSPLWNTQFREMVNLLAESEGEFEEARNE